MSKSPSFSVVFPVFILFNTQAINDEHAEKQQMAPLAEGEEDGEGVSHFDQQRL